MTCYSLTGIYSYKEGSNHQLSPQLILVTHSTRNSLCTPKGLRLQPNRPFK